MIHPFGVLNVRKPHGMTSRRVVDIVQHMLLDAAGPGTRKKDVKVGHAGTLDPLATGVLVVCVGTATKLIPFVQQQSKTYRAEFLLGRRSDTDDLEGEVTTVEVVSPPDEEAVRAALPAFVGRIEQVPPAFSAVRVDGRRAYALARKGRDFDLESKRVDVHRIDLVRFAWPLLVVDVECGSGTYIRSIGRDLGESLGCGAVMSALERTDIGPFSNADAIDPVDLTVDRLADPRPCVAHLPEYVCSDTEWNILVHGRPIPVPETTSFGAGTPVVLVDDAGRLLSIAQWLVRDRLLKPRTVFVKP